MKFPVQGKPADIIKGSAMTTALFLAYLSLPFIGMLPGMVALSPGVYYSLKNGRGAGCVIVAASAALLAIVVGPASTAIYLMQCGVMTLALPEFLARGKGGSRSIVYGVAINLVVILAVALAYGLASGIDLHLQVVKGISSSIAQTLALYEKTGITGDDLKTLQQGMQQAGTLIGQIYPALVTVGLSIVAGFNLLLLRKIAARYPVPLALGEFNRFKNPDQLVWLLIVAGFTMLIDDDKVRLAALNLLIVIISLYFVQGMAVIGHFFNRFVVPAFARFIFYLLLAVQPFLALAVAVLGIFDLWGDFRSPKKQQNL
jgi:uncharacterized protein YybS (DUF2232 family)